MGGRLHRLRLRQRQSGDQQPEEPEEEELPLPGGRHLRDAQRQGRPLARLHHQPHRPMYAVFVTFLEGFFLKELHFLLTKINTIHSKR